MNSQDSVNSRLADLESLLLAKLRQILSDIALPAEILAVPEDDASHRFDAEVRLQPRTGKKVILLVECRRDLRPAGFEALARQLSSLAAERGGAPVLGLQVVSPRMADLCRKAGWSWFDLAGNCRIAVPGLLHVERLGNVPVRRSLPQGANLGTEATARVLRVLLSPAHAGRSWKQRELQALTALHRPGDAAVSIGLVNKVIRYLLDQSFVQEAGAEGIRVRDFSGLLSAWRAAYRLDRHERRGYFTLQKGTVLAQALDEVAVGGRGAIAYAAFSAAERQAPHVRQQKTWVYASASLLEELVRRTEAKEVDSGENLVVFVPRDLGVFLRFEASSSALGQAMGCTDPVQTYVDLCHCGGRGEEAAEALLEQLILPPWKAAGIE